MKRKIAILLTTYNGEKFIQELLDSILVTNHLESLFLYIRDDGSTDNTIRILKQYRAKYKHNIQVYFGKNIGILPGFNFLLKKSLEGDHFYFMFADQDDKWLDVKIDKLVTSLKANDLQKPKLVHSDLYVVNENLDIISESFWQYQYLHSDSINLNQILIQNVVTGCTIGINRKLAEMVYPIPEEAVMHDWWIALTASAFGIIESINEPLVYYRQHSSNTIGAQEYFFSMKKLIEPFVMSKYTRQAEAFYLKYSDKLSESQRKMLNDFIRLSYVNRIHAVKIIFTHSFYKIGFLRNLGLLAKILFQKRK
ncbi:glycosyltransferase family 2 protein [Paenibacillus mesotrionivorans]|uniref:Glycosyltransferase family 2 protein n=1 Tax=Paenibacillus mesotrionivorans TaxID=3160968 RepID=A0ACC7P036_9BACL